MNVQFLSMKAACVDIEFMNSLFAQEEDYGLWHHIHIVCTMVCYVEDN